MSFETSVGTSDADCITRHGPRPRARPDGQGHAHRAGLPGGAAAACPRRRRRASSTPCSSRSPTTASPRPSSPRGSPTPARRNRSRARSRPACWAPAACSWVWSRTRCASSTQIGDDVEGAVARELEAGRRIPGLGHPVHKVAGPAHAADLRDRRGDRADRARISRRLRELAAAHAQPDRPRAAHQRRRAWPAPRWPTSASRPRSCAVSRCWRGPRGCSVTSRKRCRALLGCVSTARWMSVRSMTRRPGSSGGVQATSGGWQASVRRSRRGRARR